MDVLAQFCNGVGKLIHISEFVLGKRALFICAIQLEQLPFVYLEILSQIFEVLIDIVLDSSTVVCKLFTQFSKTLIAFLAFLLPPLLFLFVVGFLACFGWLRVLLGSPFAAGSTAWEVITLAVRKGPG